MYKITTIPGDGIGEEVIKPAVEILETFTPQFDFIYRQAGAQCYKECGTNLPDDTVDTARDSDAILFGAVTSIPQQKSAIVTLRRELDLYVNQRPIKSYTDNNTDFTIIRENSEGLYSNMEEEITGGVIATRSITHKASERITRYAFEYAKSTKREKITAVHKSNVLPLTDGVFKDEFYKMAQNYPSIKPDDYYIDAAAMYLIQKPEEFDVIVTTNLFGDILSDEAAGLVGSLGLLPSANIGDNNGLFEPVHGSAPDIAGKNKANPIAMILSASFMLRFLGLDKEADILQKATEDVIYEGKIKTPDMGGTNTTQQVADSILHKL